MKNINGVNNECEITTVVYNILYYDKITNDIKKPIHQPGSITIERIVLTLHLYGRISAFDRVMCYRRIDEWVVVITNSHTMDCLLRSGYVLNADRLQLLVSCSELSSTNNHSSTLTHIFCSCIREDQITDINFDHVLST